MLESLFTLEAMMALLTLTALEIVLGIDNIIFIAILVGRLPQHQRDKGRVFGLALAMVTRILLLLSLFWIMKLTNPLFTILAQEISGRDLILIVGGLFLLFKSTNEIHQDIEEAGEEEKELKKGSRGFFNTLIQIAILDIVFSLDSVITAVGMANDIIVMILAVVIAVGVMMFASKSISNFIDANPTIKILALSFLILVGVTLIAEGLDFHISKAYVYFAMAFSLAVESLNIYSRKKKAKKSMVEKRGVMFSLFRSSHAFAIDLGTNNTLVYQPSKGIILDEPTSIAFDSKRSSFIDCGASSKRMWGKNPKHIEVMHPLSKGAISNLTVAKAYIKEVIARITQSRFFKPTIVVSVPSDLNLMERNAVVEACKDGGAREVMLIKDPFSAALGSMQAIERPQGVLVLDIGAGVSDISLLSCNGIVMSKSLRVAGNDLDEAIIEYFKAHYRILISQSDAERLKQELGNLFEHEEKTMKINVKNLISRLPESFVASSKDVHQAIVPLADKMVTLTHSMLSELPPVFAQDIYDQGILLTGGSAMLQGLDRYISTKLEIEVNVVKNPLQNIILGAGRALEEARYNPLLGA